MDNLISSDILWSAQEAKRMTKESIKNFNSQQLSDISQKITNAITDGDFAIEYKDDLDGKTYKKLIVQYAMKARTKFKDNTQLTLIKLFYILRTRANGCAIV